MNEQKKRTENSPNLNDECQFGVAFSTHAAIVDVGRAANDEIIIDDHQLGMDVNELRYLCDSQIS